MGEILESFLKLRLDIVACGDMVGMAEDMDVVMQRFQGLLGMLENCEYGAPAGSCLAYIQQSQGSARLAPPYK